MQTLSTSPSTSNLLAWLSALLGLLASIAAATVTITYPLQIDHPLPEPWNTLMHLAYFVSLIGLVALIVGIVALVRRTAPQAGKNLAILGIVTGAIALFMILILIPAIGIIVLVTGHPSV